MKNIQIGLGYVTISSYLYIVFWFVNIFLNLPLTFIFVLLFIFSIIAMDIKEGESSQNPLSFKVSLRMKDR